MLGGRGGALLAAHRRMAYLVRLMSVRAAGAASSASGGPRRRRSAEVRESARWEPAPPSRAALIAVDDLQDVALD